MSNLRPAVTRFAELMEEKLRKHDEERGERGWLECRGDWLGSRLQDECAELERAYFFGDVEQQIREAVDVANFAMMIADRLIERQGNE